MSKVEEIIERLLVVEGRYVDHPSDRGGPTNWGITEEVARFNGWKGKMVELPREFARNIYRRRYISGPGFDRLIRHSEELAHEVIDTGVNMGPAVAAMFLQRWLNAFNSAGRYADLFVDGRVGPMTDSALGKYLAWRGAEGHKVLLNALNAIQGARYLEIAEGDKSQRDFIYGWIRHRVTIS